MLDVERTLEKSQAMTGPLGAVAFVVLEALATTDTPSEQLELVRTTLFERFAMLSDADANVLAEVAHRRLRDPPEGGSWYGTQA